MPRCGRSATRLPGHRTCAQRYTRPAKTGALSRLAAHPNMRREWPLPVIQGPDGLVWGWNVWRRGECQRKPIYEFSDDRSEEHTPELQSLMRISYAHI